MTDGRIFLGITSLISVGVFLNGLRFARMTSNPWAGKKLLGLPVEGSELPIEQVNRIGKLQMIAAPLFLLFFGALSFGLLGPVAGIATIELR